MEPAKGEIMSQTLETATLAAGCFWCVEAVFQEMNGVHQVISGYTGGKVPNPTYEQICMGNTGHAEAIQVTFDPEVIGFEDILSIFWRTHDPTTLNRQGPDSGTQYRSAIFYHDERQRAIAERSKQEAEAARLWPHPIVTEITPLQQFYEAEGYHQNYYRDNPYQPYCFVIIDPKMRKFRKEFTDKLKEASESKPGTPLRERLFGKRQ